MKKFLLGTTALVGFVASTAAVAGGAHYAAPAAVAPAAQAGGLTVMIGGNIDSQVAVTDQENTATTAAGEEINDADFATDAEIHFTVAGSAEDFDYGAVIELNTTSMVMLMVMLVQATQIKLISLLSLITSVV